MQAPIKQRAEKAFFFFFLSFFFFGLLHVSGRLTQGALCLQMAARLGEAGAAPHNAGIAAPREQVGRGNGGSTDPQNIRGTQKTSGGPTKRQGGEGVGGEEPRRRHSWLFSCAWQQSQRQFWLIDL